MPMRFALACLTFSRFDNVATFSPVRLLMYAVSVGSFGHATRVDAPHFNWIQAAQSLIRLWQLTIERSNTTL